MKIFRISIARWMGLVAILALNAALVRSFVVREMFEGVILLMVALQVGLWRLACSEGRRRRFWAGFVASGTIVFLVLLTVDPFPDSPQSRLLRSYWGFASNFAFEHLDDPLADYFDEHQDRLNAVLYFLPELVAAVLGGLIVRLIPEGLISGRRGGSAVEG